MKVKISENIRFYRKQMHLTQGELAALINGKTSLVSNYENGDSTPDIYVLCRLCKIFDVTLDELVECSWEDE
ncbi:MAG: helix-turn-helix transcriptional regulator [Christensenellaceae bacterium]